MQLSFFNLDDPLLESIKEEIVNIDIDTLDTRGSLDETQRNQAHVTEKEACLKNSYFL